MSNAISLILIGGLLTSCGAYIYIKAVAFLTSEERSLLQNALANPTPITTALYVAFLVGSMGMLVIAAVTTGAGLQVLLLAPPSACLATFIKSYMGVKPLRLAPGWKDQFYLGMGLVCAGISLGFAGVAVKFLF